jgi:hypothetical protein
VAVQLGLVSLVNPFSVALGTAAFLILLRAPLAAPLLVVAAAVLGIAGVR